MRHLKKGDRDQVPQQFVLTVSECGAQLVGDCHLAYEPGETERVIAAKECPDEVLTLYGLGYRSVPSKWLIIRKDSTCSGI